MRLLFLCNSRLFGGAERYTLAVACGLAARGHACFVAAPPGSPTLEAATAADEVTEVPFDLGPKLSRRSALEAAVRWRRYRRRMECFLGKIVPACGIDVLHAQFKKEQLLATPAASALGLPVVWTEHGHLPRLFAAMPSVMPRYRRVAATADRILCVSGDVRRDLAAHGVAGTRVRVCCNGIVPGPPATPQERARVRTMLGLAPDLFVVGCTARLAPAKGQRILLHAVAALRSTIPGIRLVLVGDGPERPALERLTRQLELTGHVIFLGMRDDARALLPAFEVFAAPSLTEGMPFAILEAMAAARPILATRVGGVPEALADGQAGILVAPGRPEPLIDGLDRLFREPRLRHELSSAARKRLVERFSIDAMLDKTEAAFLAAGGAVPPAARHARAFVAV